MLFNLSVPHFLIWKWEKNTTSFKLKKNSNKSNLFHAKRLTQWYLIFFFILSSYLQRLKPEAPERLQKHTIVYYRKPYTSGNCHLSLFFHPITKSDPFYLDVSEINSILSTPLPHKGSHYFSCGKRGIWDGMQIWRENINLLHTWMFMTRWEMLALIAKIER